MVLQLIFTEWLLTLEWLEPVLSLSFLNPCSTISAAEAWRIALKADPVPPKIERCRRTAGLTAHRVPSHCACLSRSYLLLGFIFKYIVYPLQVVSNLLIPVHVP